MNGSRYYGVRVEGAKYGVGFGSALAIAISYVNNHSILWAIIDGIFVNGSAHLVGSVSQVIRRVQSGRVYHYAFMMILGVFVLLTWWIARA